MDYSNGSASSLDGSASTYTKAEFERQTVPAGTRVGLTPIPENVPDDLREWPHFVMWRFEMREQKRGQFVRTKVPWRSSWTGPRFNKLRLRRAASNNPRTWGQFDIVVCDHDFLLDSPVQMDGIGFVLTADDPFTVIDLDDSRNSATGELTPEAETIVARFNSYTEVSPSGTGVKIFVRARKPGERCKHTRRHIEVYDRKRFVAITGRPALENGPMVVAERQAELNAFYDELFPADEIPNRSGGANSPVVNREAPLAPNNLSDLDIVDRAACAKNGAKFVALWTGDASAYDSQSDADFALAGMLAFYVGPDPARVESLMRQSGLRRHKWERRDYLRRTITQAIARRTEWYGQWNGRRDDLDDELAGLETITMVRPRTRDEIRRTTNAQILASAMAPPVVERSPEDLLSDEQLASWGHLIAEDNRKEQKEKELRVAKTIAETARTEFPCKKPYAVMMANIRESKLLFRRCGRWTCTACRQLHVYTWGENIDLRFRQAVDQKKSLYTATVTRREWQRRVARRCGRTGSNHFLAWCGSPEQFTIVCDQPVNGFAPITVENATATLKRLVGDQAFDCRHIHASEAWRIPREPHEPTGDKRMGPVPLPLPPEKIEEIAAANRVQIKYKDVGRHLRPWVLRIVGFVHPFGWTWEHIAHFYFQLAVGEVLPFPDPDDWDGDDSKTATTDVFANAIDATGDLNLAYDTGGG
jgi:hypothetical protein